MSELTLCNYCSLAELRDRARRKRQPIAVLPPGKHQKCADMFEVRIGGKAVAWFVELPDSCRC